MKQRNKETIKKEQEIRDLLKTIEAAEEKTPLTGIKEFTSIARTMFQTMHKHDDIDGLQKLHRTLELSVQTIQIDPMDYRSRDLRQQTAKEAIASAESLGPSGWERFSEAVAKFFSCFFDYTPSQTIKDKEDFVFEASVFNNSRFTFFQPPKLLVAKVEPSAKNKAAAEAEKPEYDNLLARDESFTT